MKKVIYFSYQEYGVRNLVTVNGSCQIAFSTHFGEKKQITENDFYLRDLRYVIPRLGEKTLVKIEYLNIKKLGTFLSRDSSEIAEKIMGVTAASIEEFKYWAKKAYERICMTHEVPMSVPGFAIEDICEATGIKLESWAKDLNQPRIMMLSADNDFIAKISPLGSCPELEELEGIHTSKKNAFRIEWTFHNLTPEKWKTMLTNISTSTASSLIGLLIPGIGALITFFLKKKINSKIEKELITSVNEDFKQIISERINADLAIQYYCFEGEGKRKAKYSIS